MIIAAEKGHRGPPSSSSLPSFLCFFFGALLITSRNLAKFSGVMQPSNLHGAADRLDKCIEELCWENGQLFESTERDKWTAPSPSYSLSDLSLQSTDKEHPLKLADLEDEKIEGATAFATTDDLTDLLDDLGCRNSVGMTRDAPLPSEMKRCDPLPQHLPSLSGSFEDLARLCGPSLQSGHLGVDARCRSVVPTLPFNLPRNDLSKLSDAVLNRISAKCMGPSLQSLENTLLNQSARDPLMLNATHINPVGNLLSSSNAASRSSVDISPSSDLESVLLDSSGSGFNPGNGGKAGDITGVKKARAVDDLDSDSEGSFDDILAPRKPRQEQGPSSKRMRAAEIHNEAERKRRGRINEKLKALQELIPNANKTDKASVLNEAIEYLKKLRLQLQMMCCRNGLVVSPYPDSQQEQNPPMQHAGACLSMDGGSQAAQGQQNSAPPGLPKFPATNTAAQECAVPTNVPPFNDSSFPATTAFVSAAKGIGHDRYQF